MTFAQTEGNVATLAGLGVTNETDRLTVSVKTTDTGDANATTGRSEVQVVTLTRTGTLTDTVASGKTLIGSPLLEGSLLDRFYIVPTGSGTGSGISATVAVNGQADLGASLGILDLSFGGGIADTGDAVAFTVNPSLSLTDPNSDGKIRFSELTSGLSNIVTPAFSYGGELNLQLDSSLLDFLPAADDLDLRLKATLAEDTTKPIVPGVFKPKLEFDTTSFGEFKELLGGFKDLSLADIAAMLQRAVEVLQNSDIDGLNTPLPLINKTPNDVLSFTDALLEVANDLLAPVDTAQLKNLSGQIDQALEALGGTPEQIAKVADAVNAFKAAIDADHSFKLQLKHSDGRILADTGSIPSDTSAFELQKALQTVTEIQTFDGSAGTVTVK